MKPQRLAMVLSALSLSLASVTLLAADKANPDPNVFIMGVNTWDGITDSHPGQSALNSKAGSPGVQLDLLVHTSLPLAQGPALQGQDKEAQIKAIRQWLSDHAANNYAGVLDYLKTLTPGLANLGFIPKELNNGVQGDWQVHAVVDRSIKGGTPYVEFIYTKALTLPSGCGPEDVDAYLDQQFHQTPSPINGDPKVGKSCVDAQVLDTIAIGIINNPT